MTSTDPNKPNPYGPQPPKKPFERLGRKKPTQAISEEKKKSRKVSGPYSTALVPHAPSLSFPTSHESNRDEARPKPEGSASLFTVYLDSADDDAALIRWGSDNAPLALSVAKGINTPVGSVYIQVGDTEVAVTLRSGKNPIALPSGDTISLRVVDAKSMPPMHQENFLTPKAPDQGKLTTRPSKLGEIQGGQSRRRRCEEHMINVNRLVTDPRRFLAAYNIEEDVAKKIPVRDLVLATQVVSQCIKDRRVLCSSRDILPGPGHYEIAWTLRESVNGPVFKQKFFEGSPRDSKSDIPGPGTYDQRAPQNLRTTVLSGRFHDFSNVKEPMAGPGQYDYANYRIGQDVRPVYLRSRLGAPEDQYHLRESAAVPGPGSYPLPNLWKPNNVSLPPRLPDVHSPWSMTYGAKVVD